MSVQRETRMVVLGRALAAALAVGACGEDRPAAGNVTGGEGGAGSTACPLDEEDRARAEAAIGQAVAEASWITTQTHGIGAFASRAFGFGIPFATVGALFSASLAEACVEAKTFDEYCSGAEEGGSGPDTCSQMECLEAGKLQVTTWFEPLPFTTVAEPGPGEVEVRQARQTATFTEHDDETVTIEWQTDLGVVPPDADALTITETGSAAVGGPSHEEVVGLVIVNGLTGEPLSLEFEFGEEGVSGSATVDGDEVLELTNDGPVWSASCSQ